MVSIEALRRVRDCREVVATSSRLVGVLGYDRP
jgi:hypothetical protein